MKEINEIIKREGEIIQKTLLANKNQLRDEFALRLAPTFYKEFKSRYGGDIKHAAIECYKFADFMVKESEKYRNGRKEVNKDD